MAKKKVNRKKLLKKQWAELKKAGKVAAEVVADKAQEATEVVKDVAEKTVKTVSEKVQDVVEVAKEKVEEVKNQAGNFDSFVEELKGVAPARLETFYAEGIQSAKDFANWTEKELLALKGIGPATIKQLQELGITLKK